MLTQAFRRFIASESSAGVVLALAAVLAIALANSPWGEAYARWLQTPGVVQMGGGAGGERPWLVLAKPLVVWINDLWMAVFFFLVGLEIKRELTEGQLADRRQAVLPAAAALGGMAVPALIYAALN
ncbi:MAG: Na+/H+ antiporter NhaA, partial [Rubrivivax sp.]|nr:Na+/H+ antiporter NhaA [Rubrivivax sp.]